MIELTIYDSNGKKVVLDPCIIEAITDLGAFQCNKTGQEESSRCRIDASGSRCWIVCESLTEIQKAIKAGGEG